MIKIALLNTVALLSLSVTACNAESPNSPSRIQVLSQACKELSDETGRDYHPVVGRYLGSESKTSMSPTHSGHRYLNHTLVFENGD